jgi:serine/threonine-protein kinase
MVPTNADRNLLFGALALQLDFITSEALVAAVAAWVRDRSRPLDAILAEQGGLSDSRRALLQPLVDEHLRAHGGDPGASLAAARVPTTLREDLTRAGGPDVEASLAAAVGVGANDRPGETLSYGSDGESTAGRFRVLRPLARGGIGVVSVALDAELNREVALKQIQTDRADDPASRARFTLEAEVTGRLEHPGVVPVYGLGCDAEGRPYYAMRLIKGDSLKEAVARLRGDTPLPAASMPLRGLLNRFVTACYAVAYAHSRGVIHRDIKPSNIMLGPYGETLVVDWGLAKVVGRDDPSEDPAETTLRPASGSGTGMGETAAGSAVGTPAYMSPEQAEGRLDNVGPASDVYSLGATLYCLLTGRPPIDAPDVGTVLRLAARGEFPTPRSVNPRAPMALEAVCLKAMALKPAERYASARALAEEIEHWLADEPVSALREPALTRLARWGRRHKTGVAASVALLAASVVALGAGTVLLGRANDRVQRERDLARKNFTLARQAVDDYLTRVGQNPLLKEQGPHDLRQELLGAALRYFRDFLTQQGGDPALRAQAAAAYERVGDIGVEMGKPKDALEAYDKGLALADSLVRERPGDIAAATMRVRFQVGREFALRDDGRSDESIAAFERAVALEYELAKTRARGDETSAVMAKAYLNAAYLYRNDGKTAAAVRTARQAVEYGESYARVRPDDLANARILLQNYGSAAHILRVAGQVDESRALGEKGASYGQDLVRKYPRDIELRMYLAELDRIIGDDAKAEGDLTRALESIQRSIALVEAVTQENPLLFRPRAILANALIDLGQVQCDLNKLPEAEKTSRMLVGLAGALAKEFPKNRFLQLMLGFAHATLGKVLVRQGSPGDALDHLQRAVKILDDSQNVMDMYQVACCYALASTVTDPAEGATSAGRRRENADRAVTMLRRAFDKGFMDRSLMKTDPDLATLQTRDDFRALIRLMEDKARANTNAPKPGKP